MGAAMATPTNMQPFKFLWHFKLIGFKNENILKHSVLSFNSSAGKGFQVPIQEKVKIM